MGGSCKNVVCDTTGQAGDAALSPAVVEEEVGQDAAASDEDQLVEVAKQPPVEAKKAVSL